MTIALSTSFDINNEVFTTNFELQTTTKTSDAIIFEVSTVATLINGRANPSASPVTHYRADWSEWTNANTLSSSPSTGTEITIGTTASTSASSSSRQIYTSQISDLSTAAISIVQTTII